MRISDWSSDGALPIFPFWRWRARLDAERLSSLLPDAARRRQARWHTDRQPQDAEPDDVEPSGRRRRPDPAQRRHLFGRRECRGRLRPRLRGDARPGGRSEEHTSELQSLMRISYAVFCLKKKKRKYTRSQR